MSETQPHAYKCLPRRENATQDDDDGDIGYHLRCCSDATHFLVPGPQYDPLSCRIESRVTHTLTLTFTTLRSRSQRRTQTSSLVRVCSKIRADPKIRASHLQQCQLGCAIQYREACICLFCFCPRAMHPRCIKGMQRERQNPEVESRNFPGGWGLTSHQFDMRLHGGHYRGHYVRNYKVHHN